MDEIKKVLGKLAVAAESIGNTRAGRGMTITCYDCFEAILPLILILLRFNELFRIISREICDFMIEEKGNVSKTRHKEDGSGKFVMNYVKEA